MCVAEPTRYVFAVCTILPRLGRVVWKSHGASLASPARRASFSERNLTSSITELNEHNFRNNESEALCGAEAERERERKRKKRRTKLEFGPKKSAAEADQSSGTLSMAAQIVFLPSTAPISVFYSRYRVDQWAHMLLYILFNGSIVFWIAWSPGDPYCQ